MNIERLSELVKEAKMTNGLELLPKINTSFESKIPKIEGIEIPTPQSTKAPELPKLEKLKPLKLETGFGKSKPAFTHELKTNSPYNEK